MFNVSLCRHSSMASLKSNFLRQQQLTTSLKSQVVWNLVKKVYTHYIQGDPFILSVFKNARRTFLWCQNT